MIDPKEFHRLAAAARDAQHRQRIATEALHRANAERDNAHAEYLAASERFDQYITTCAGEAA